jgi:predicted nucleic acid-binding protein
MNGVFANAFYFIALLNPANRHQAAAVATSESLSEPLVTTRWVLVEVAHVPSAPGTRGRVANFLRKVDADPKILVVPMEDEVFVRGLDLFEHRTDKAWSLTDCISFVVMSERGLTGDHPFEQARFRTLLRTESSAAIGPARGRIAEREAATSAPSN